MLLSIILQTLCLLAAGYGLWRLWRFVARHGTMIALIVAGGFVARSLAGQLLFWVSYLKLPYGRSLQLGDGLWFFGLDALHYYGIARRAAFEGLGTILTLPPEHPSVVYIKAVGVFLWLFGSASSAAILLNLVAYLGSAALIILLAERRGVDRRIVAVALAALALLPSAILWSLQPLKDAFVTFLALVFAYAVDEFVAAWRSEAGRARTIRLVLLPLLLIATTYAVAGIRWYFAMIMLAAAAIPLLAIIFSARDGRSTLIRAAFAAVLIFVLTQNVVAGAGTYLPPGMRSVLRPWSTRGGITERIEHVEQAVEISRKNMDSYKGATTRIRAGTAVLEKEAEEARAAAAAPSPQPQPAPPAAKADTAPPPKTDAAPPAKTAAAPPPVTKTAKPVEKPATPAVTTPAPQPAPAAAPAPAVAKVETPTPAPAHAAAPAPATPAPAPTTPAPAVDPDTIDVPTTRSGRMIAGMTALLLPRRLGVSLGLVSISGGRGLMWFAELDTILFNILMIACGVIFFSGLRRGAWRDPFLWYLIAVTVVLGAALAYTVSNYGTLFRHRQMVVAPLMLIAIAAARSRREADPPGEVA